MTKFCNWMGISLGFSYRGGGGDSTLQFSNGNPIECSTTPPRGENYLTAQNLDTTMLDNADVYRIPVYSPASLTENKYFLRDRHSNLK